MGTFKDFIIDQLSACGGIQARSMFGGWGIYQDQTFFGIIHKERVYFKTNFQTAEKYRAEGMDSFQPNPKQNLKNYFEVPLNVLESPLELKEWAEEAIQIAR